VKTKFRFRFWPSLLVVIIVYSLFHAKAVHDFFYGIDPNEMVTRTLEWKTTAGEDRRAVFNIPRGYYEPSALNKPGETIDLVLLYPNQAFVPRHERVPGPNKVSILIKTRGEHTLGDRFKDLMDAGTLEAESGNKLLGKRGEMFVLRTISPNEVEPETYVFHDTVRGHWISSVPKQGGDFRLGEATLKDQTAYVWYIYRNSTETNPIAMHQWVMAFVENLQVEQPATKAKQP
jgi:hypothetical protein